MQLKKISAEFESELMNWWHKHREREIIHLCINSMCRNKWTQIITTVSFPKHLIFIIYRGIKWIGKGKCSCWWWLLGVFRITSVLLNIHKHTHTHTLKCVIKSKYFLILLFLQSMGTYPQTTCFVSHFFWRSTGHKEERKWEKWRWKRRNFFFSVVCMEEILPYRQLKDS